MKSAILNLGKDTVIYGLGTAINRFVGLLMLPLFTSYLNPEEYGILAMLALLNLVIQPVFSLGMSVAMGASYFEQMTLRNHSTVLWTVATINFISAAFLILIAFLFSKHIAKLISLDEKHSILILLTMLGLAATVVSTGFMQKLQFDKKASTFALVSVLSSLSAVIISSYLVIFQNFGVLGMVFGQVTGSLLSCLFFIIFGSAGTHFIYKHSVAKELLKLGIPMVPSFAFLFIIMHANKYVLEYYSGLDAVGIYSIGYNLGMAISLITSAVSTAWYPFFMSYINKHDEAKSMFPKIFEYYFYFIGLICVCFFLFAKPIIIFLTEPSFHDAWMVVGFIAAANFCGAAFNFLLPGLYFKKEVMFVSLLQGITVCLSLPVTFFLIKKFSIVGAGMSVVYGNLLMLLIVGLWNYHRRHKYIAINYDYKHIMKIIFSYAALLAAFHFLPVNSVIAHIAVALCILSIICCYLYFFVFKNEKFPFKASKGVN